MAVVPDTPDPERRRDGGTNALIAVAGLGSQQAASLVVTLLAAGVLGVAEYGTYAVAVVFVEFVVMLTHTGYFHFLVASDEDEGAVLSTMFWLMLAIGTAGGATLVLTAGVLAEVFAAPDLAPVLRVLGCLQPFAAAVGWASAALTRAGRMRRHFLNLAGANLGGMLAGAALLWLWPSLFALVAWRAARIALGLGLSLAAVPRRPGRRFDRALARRATGYATGLYGARLLGFLSTFGADLVLAFLFSTTEAGLYRFANRLASGAVDLVAQPLRSFALKRLAFAARTGAPPGPELRRLLSAMVLLGGGVAAALCLLGPTLVAALFRPEYLAAAATLQVLAIRAAALAGTSLIEPVFAARHATRVGFWHHLVWSSVMLGAVLLAAPAGVQTVAVWQAVVALTASCAALWVIARWGGLPVAPALRAGLGALLLVALYAGGLAVVRVATEAVLPPEARLPADLGAALLLAVPVLVVALRTRLLDMRVFS